MSSAEIFLGHIMDGYRLKQILGQGGTSVVFLGERVAFPQELVAIKVLLPLPSLSIDEVIECRRRFAREILTLRERLHHPSILPILASGEDPSTGYPYLVIPYISGGSLAERLESGNLSLDKVPSYVMQIAETLDYAHSQQVIHRDLKPANILVDEEDHVYLVDFGTVKLFDRALTQISQFGQAIGTPEYMAPEQAFGAPVSSATDIYGLAVLAYTLVTGRLPFPSASIELMLMQVTTMQPIPPRTFRSDLPEPAEAALLRALSKDPKDRFATACEFAQALAQGLAGQWPQGLRSPRGASLQAQGHPLPAFAASVVADGGVRDKYAAPLARAFDLMKPLLTGKKRSSGRVLISRRKALLGLMGLSAVVGSGTLWYLLNNPFSPSNPSLSFTPAGRTQPPMGSTPTPTNQSTPPVSQMGANPNPIPISTAVSPLRVAITDIPSQVMNGDTVSVMVTTSQPGIPVTLHVIYGGLLGAVGSFPRITDVEGKARFSWSVLVFQTLNVVHAVVEATAHDAQGERVISPLVNVRVMPRNLLGGGQDSWWHEGGR